MTIGHITQTSPAPDDGDQGKHRNASTPTATLTHQVLVAIAILLTASLRGLLSRYRAVREELQQAANLLAALRSELAGLERQAAGHRKQSGQHDSNPISLYLAELAVAMLSITLTYTAALGLGLGFLESALITLATTFGEVLLVWLVGGNIRNSEAGMSWLTWLGIGLGVALTITSAVLRFSYFRTNSVVSFYSDPLMVAIAITVISVILLILATAFLATWDEEGAGIKKKLKSANKAKSRADKKVVKLSESLRAKRTSIQAAIHPAAAEAQHQLTGHQVTISQAAAADGIAETLGVPEVLNDDPLLDQQ